MVGVFLGGQYPPLQALLRQQKVVKQKTNIYPLVNDHMAGISPCSIGNTFFISFYNPGPPFSIAMLDYRSVLTKIDKTYGPSDVDGWNLVAGFFSSPWALEKKQSRDILERESFMGSRTQECYIHVRSSKNLVNF